MNNSKKSSKKNSEKVNKANEANKEKKVVTIEQVAQTFLEENKNVSKTAEKLGLVYLFAHRDDNNKLLHKGEKGYGNECRLVFEGKTYTQDQLNRVATGEGLRRKNTPKKNNGLSKVQKLEDELNYIIARKKEIEEKLLPAARAEAAKKKEEATKAADEKAEVNIEKTISSYQVKTGCSAVEAEESLLKKLLARQAAREAAANA